MGRPGLNKNERIRINIEQRYFLEDRFSKQGKLKAGAVVVRGGASLYCIARFCFTCR